MIRYRGEIYPALFHIEFMSIARVKAPLDSRGPNTKLQAKSDMSLFLCKRRVLLCVKGARVGCRVTELTSALKGLPQVVR